VPDTIPDSHRIHFLLRRLHSLTGIVPIGVFLCIHLLTNSSIVWGKYLTDPHVTNPAHGGVEEFIHDVNFIHSLPMLIFIEVFGLWLPIAFHIVLGIYYAVSGRPNVGAYGYSNNWRYTLQRLSGYLGVLFIFMHVASLRWGWTFGGLLPSFSVDAAASSTALHFQAGSSLRTFIITAFYLVSVSASSSAGGSRASPPPSGIAEQGVPVDLFSWSPSSGRTASAPRAASTPATTSPASRATPSTSTSTRRSTAATSSPTSRPSTRWRNWAPKIIDLLDRMGVPFNRTRRARDLRLFGGSALQADPLRRRDDGPAAPVRPRRADPTLRGRGQGQQVRVLGVPLARHR
jgi:succinate dehydrogenase/fumarate reductase cytochrome b subunit